MNRPFEHKIGEEVEVPLVVLLVAQMVGKRLCGDGSRCWVRESLEGDVLVPNRLEMLLGPSQRPLDEYMEGCVVVGAPVVEEPALRLDGPWDVDVKKTVHTHGVAQSLAADILARLRWMWGCFRAIEQACPLLREGQDWAREPRAVFC